MSWEDAQIYIDWLNIRHSTTYRLPSESEREYATRAGSITNYNWGENIDCSQADYWSENCNARGTSIVKSYLPNAFSLFDMHGNVWEWVQDCLNEDYVGAPTNGSAWESGDCTNRMLKGGSWASDPTSLYSSARSSNAISLRFLNIGFRLAQDI